MIEYQGEQWELIPFDELKNYEGQELLMFNVYRQVGGLMVIPKIERRLRGYSLVYNNPSPWNGSRTCMIEPDMYNYSRDNRMPYRRVGPVDPLKCYCNGPTVSKWCYDSNKVEKLCVRCKKRKR